MFFSKNFSMAVSATLTIFFHFREHLDILKSNGVGMDEALVDSEDYPRNDIDVYQVNMMCITLVFGTGHTVNSHSTFRRFPSPRLFPCV